MQLGGDVNVDDSAEEVVVRAFAARHGIAGMAVFGSMLRQDFAPDSDVDVAVDFAVDFAPGRTPGLARLVAMELELEDALGHEVELRTPEDLSPRFRAQVVATSRVLVDG